MTAYSKYNIVYLLQKWMDSVPGQTFLNYAYSWGASIVILGTLFKLTHLPGANIMLYLGMGTEVVVFFLSAFDRPFDKTADGMDLALHTEDESSENAPNTSFGAVAGGTVVGVAMPAGAVVGGAAIVSANAGDAVMPDAACVSSVSSVVPQAAPDLSEVFSSTGMKEATDSYITELNNLSEMLKQVADQSQRLTRDSEEMETLNRTLTGISRVYEMQLKSASAQIGTIDEINEQSKKMAEQITELNKIYARMIEAIKVKA